MKSGVCAAYCHGGFMTKSEKAVQCHIEGFNCSQAVFSAYSGECGLSVETAKKIASGFGGGMGRLCETCGAVTGAFMVIGLMFSTGTADKENKEKIYAMIRDFANRFRERNKTIKCEDLLGVNLLTGDRELSSRQVKTVCPKVIGDSAEILDEMLKNQP